MAAGTSGELWRPTIAPGSSTDMVHRVVDHPVCIVGSRTLRYPAGVFEDLGASQTGHSDRVLPGAADEETPAADGSVEARGRSSDNPVGG